MYVHTYVYLFIYLHTHVYMIAHEHTTASKHFVKKKPRFDENASNQKQKPDPLLCHVKSTTLPPSFSIMYVRMSHLHPLAKILILATTNHQKIRLTCITVAATATYVHT